MAGLALITGASGGIGEAIARELSQRGFRLILVARSLDKLQALASELGNAEAISCDLTQPGQGASLLEKVGAIDILVNNAGFATYGPFTETPLDRQLQMIQLNISALTELTHTFLPGMIERKKGRIMNVASTAAFVPGPTMAVYFATKAYVLSFSEAMVEELKGTGVTVTCLCPGPTESGFQDAAQMQESRLVQQKLLTSEFVAAKGVEAMLAGKALEIPSQSDRVQIFSLRFAPRGVVAENVKRAMAKRSQ